MRTLLTLINREIRSFFYQPIAYVVMFFVLMVAGFNFWIGVTYMMGEPTEHSIVEYAFNMVPFWMVFILGFPAITMRTYAEEYRLGTFETLTTAPVNDWQVVLSKFAGSFFFYCVLWAPTLLHFVIFGRISNEDISDATGSLLGAYLLLFLMGMTFSAGGCLASSLVKDQVNAAVISTCALLLWFFVPFLPNVLRITNSEVLERFNYFSAVSHMMEFSRGVIDTRPIVWYTTATIFLLVLNLFVFQHRKWKS